MINFIVMNDHKRLVREIERLAPGASEAMQRAKETTLQTRRQVYDFQAMLIYMLAKQYNHAGARLFEIGSAHGFSCAMLAQACPLAKEIITCTPNPGNYDSARRSLIQFANVRVMFSTSQDLLATYSGAPYDFIFVDGDHNRIATDLPWYNHLKTGGLFLHHDYSPDWSARPTPPVYHALDDFATKLKHAPEVYVMDTGFAGMPGWYKREGEKWPTNTVA